MIDTSTLDISQLRDSYVAANIPAYLYRHFRANQSVQALGSKYSSLDLAREIQSRMDSTAPELDDVVVAYAALIALTFHSSGEVEAALAKHSVAGLDWAADILDLWKSTRVLASSSAFTVKPTLVTDQRISSGSSSLIIPGR